MPEKKGYVSVSKGVHKQKLCNLQKSFNFELYTAFKEKHPNVNVGFSKFCAVRPKWFVRAGSKMTHSVCVCSTHQNFLLLESNRCITHRCKSCPGTATLK